MTDKLGEDRNLQLVTLEGDHSRWSGVRHCKAFGLGLSKGSKGLALGV